MEIILQRPEEMSQKEYKRGRNYEQHHIKKYLKNGTVIWDSSRKGTFRGSVQSLMR